MPRKGMGGRRMRAARSVLLICFWVFIADAGSCVVTWNRLRTGLALQPWSVVRVDSKYRLPVARR